MSDDRKTIRFINSGYDNLFQIRDGDSILISFPDGETAERTCTFIDEYHTQVGRNVFHICEFAEKMEEIGATYQPARELAMDKTQGRNREGNTSRRR